MIIGKVARIVSENEVVLTVGRTDLVTEGTEFVIFSVGDPIVDPDSGEILGRLETVKGRVVVTHVMERASVAKTKTYTETLSLGLGSGHFADFLGPKTVTKRIALQVKKEQIQPVSVDLTVVIGDTVREVPR